MNVQVQGSSPPNKLGRYRLIAQLGQGGMGMIHLAVAEGIGGFRKLFVIKELKQELSQNEQFLSLFMREAKLAARLNHPNVVHTVEADQEAGRYFLAMEFLDGRPFNEILRRAEQAPPVPLALRLQVICHALAGLHHAHELTDYDGRALQVVHRDVSPGNIFVTYDGQVKMLDFGIATAASDAESSEPPAFKGKIGYAAPEQLRLRPADRRTDVFACGVVLWEAIALRHLVRGKPSRQVFESRLLGTEPRIAQLIDDVDPRLAEICDRATCRDPEQRYPSAEAFCRDLQGFLIERNMSVETTEIAALMRTKFARERDNLHRLIEAQLSDEGEADSIVVSRGGTRALPRNSGARLAERTATGALPSQRSFAYPPQRKARAGLLTGLALMALAGATAWRLRSDWQKGPVEQVERSVRVPAPARAQIAATVPSVGATLEFMASDAGHSESRWPHPTHASAEPLRRGSADALSADAERARRALQKHSETSGAAGERAADDAAQAPPQRSLAPRAAQPAALDIDLRNFQRPNRRALDVENPFQR